jgi:hypothetical protein
VAHLPTSIDSLSLPEDRTVPRSATAAFLTRHRARRSGCTGDATTMKQNLWYLLFGIAPVLLLASSGAQGAQLTVLGLTLGIFFGTLSLRKPDPSDATSTNSGT